jgi:hypothetical protein
MDLLVVLTLGYVAILVLAVAVSLVAILVYLLQIRSALGDTRAALSRVSDETKPLAEHLEALRDASAGSADDMTAVGTMLEEAAERFPSQEGSASAELVR